MLKPVQGLWIGPKLSFIEQLSIKSFIDNGHPYHLYAYSPIEGVPSGTDVRDANEILPESKIFRVGGTSLGMFADLFRWKLLFERGGIWADTDVVCLRPVDLDDDMLFGEEGDGGWVGNAFLGLPPDHLLASIMYNICDDVNAFLPFDTPQALLKKTVRRVVYGKEKSRTHVRFAEPGGPAYFARHLDYYNMRRFAKPPSYFYPIPYTEWRDIMKPADEIRPRLEDSYCIHLWNSILGSDKDIDKARLKLAGTMLEEWGVKHGLL